jgi:microcystin-dependent protein
MAIVTPGYTFTNDEVVTPAKLNSAATPVVSNIVTADIVDANVTAAKIANGAVTQEKLNSSVTLVPTGAVMPFAMNSAPTGWLAADGTAVSRATYAALFSAIGTTYGVGNGSTTFNLPDLRDNFVRGSGGSFATFGQFQNYAVQSHTHSGATSVAGFHGHAVSDPGHTHQLYSQSDFQASGNVSHDFKVIGINANRYGAGYSYTGYTGIGIFGNGDHAHVFTTGEATGLVASETRPRNIALLYCIKF